MNINNIKPYLNNPMMGSNVQAVKKSIEQFGFINPITVDSNYVIVTGHSRYYAAKSMGMTDVPVIVLDHLTEEQAKKFRIADNSTSEFGAWDKKLLEELYGKYSDDDFFKNTVEEVVNFDFEDSDVNNYDIVERFEKSTVTVLCPYCYEEFEP